MSDRIAEIRKRHSKRSEIDQSGCYRLDGFTYTGSLSQSQEDVATLLAEDERQRAEIKRLRERLLQEQAALVLDEIGAALERERVMRSALTDMLSGWRYIRDTYGDLAGVGWDRVEQKARNALEGKP